MISLDPISFGFKDLKSYIFFGAKGSGKSLFTAYLSMVLMRSYYRTERSYPTLPKRQLWINAKLNPKLEHYELGKHLRYWESPRELVEARNVDIIWDEVGKDIPAIDWKETPKGIRQIFSHLRKRGNRLFANTQIYNDIDIGFRRQVDRTFQLFKVFGSRDISASLPPVSYPYGLIVIRELDKTSLELAENGSHRIRDFLFIPKILFIRRRYVDLYDTTAELPPYRPTELEHIIYRCQVTNCKHAEHIEHKKY